MTTPFVIDNQQNKMADILNDLLADHIGTRSTLPPPTSTSAAGNSCATD
jgi:hypothetical protein